jgi:hypothetical protein
VHGAPFTTRTAYLHTALPSPALRKVLPNNSTLLDYIAHGAYLHSTHPVPSLCTVLLALHALLTLTSHCLYLHYARCLPAQHTPCPITVYGAPCTTRTAYLHTALPSPALRTVLTRTVQSHHLYSAYSLHSLVWCSSLMEVFSTPLPLPAGDSFRPRIKISYTSPSTFL